LVNKKQLAHFYQTGQEEIKLGTFFTAQTDAELVL
jgi:hypothetical protein